MLKLSSLSPLLVLAIASIAASWWPAPVVATLVANGFDVQGLAPNGTLDQGRSPSGLATSFMTLRAVRLALPDGTELTFH
jgi:hypothetical protein